MNRPAIERPTIRPIADGPMPPLSRRNFLYGTAMLATAAFAAFRRPKQIYPSYSEDKFAALFPKTIGHWKAVANDGLILPPADELSKKLYQNLLTRIYRNDSGQEIMLLLAYANRQEGNIQAHRPDVCYPAAGFDIIENRETTVKLNDGRDLPGRTLVALRSNRTETLFYWVRVDRQFPVLWRDQRLAMVFANLEGDVPDGLIARVSVIDASGAAEPLLEDFVRALVDASSPRGKRILLGRGPNEDIVR